MLLIILLGSNFYELRMYLLKDFLIIAFYNIEKLLWDELCFQEKESLLLAQQVV
jgi:hypothetical protein